MAKQPQKPDDSRNPNEPPLDDTELVEFLDEIPDPPSGPAEFSFEDVMSVDEPPAPAGRKDADDVMQDELLGKAKDAGGPVSDVFSDSAVLAHSDVIRAEPLPDDIPLDPMPDLFADKPDSDVRMGETELDVEAANVEELDIAEEAVLADDVVETLPESGVIDEPIVVEVDDFEEAGAAPAGKHPAPEKEPVLDLDETLLGLDSPQPQTVKKADPTVAFDAGSDDDVSIDDLVADAVDLGGKPSQASSESGIDPVAEELESGVRLDAAPKKPASPPSVEFDELIVDDDIASVDLGEEATTKPKVASANLPGSSMDDEPILVDDDLATVKSAPAVGSEDDIDIEAMLGGEPMQAGAGVDDAEPVVVDDEPVETLAAAPVTTPKRKQPAEVAPSGEPQRRGGWGSVVGGVVLGGLLTAGAGVGVMYMAPDLLTGAPDVGKPVGMPDSVKGGKKPSPLQLAHEAMDEGEFAEVIEKLKDEDDKTSLAIRGEARWLGYFQKQTAAKAPLSKDDEEVKLALADLKKSENQLKIDQIERALGSGGAKTVIEVPAKGDEALKLELAKAIKERDEADKLVQGIGKVLADAKLLAADEKLDDQKLLIIAKEAGAAKDAIAAFNKALKDANVDGGAKGLEKLVAAKMDIENKLAEFNKVLAAANVKDDAKGLTEALASRTKLAEEMKDLVQTIEAAYKEMADAKLVAPGGDARKELIAGAKAARSRSESPLSAPLTGVAGALGSVTLGVGDALKKTYVDAAVLSEINFYRLREAFVPTPEQQLDRLAAMLSNQGDKNAALAADANRLAQWVLSPESKSSAEAKAKAQSVQTLVMQNQTKGQIDDKMKAAVRADAENAAKDPKTAAAGNFMLGRLEEQSGNLAKAEEFFREALKASSDNQQADEIRVRLGRLLLRSRAAAAPPAAPAPEPKKEEKQPEKDAADIAPKASFAHPLGDLLAAFVLTQVPAQETPEDQARIQEGIELARKLIESKDRNIQAQGHFLLGEALGRQGQPAEGIRQFAKGFELLHPDVPLSKLLDEVPTFTVPDSFQRANPLLAERHYGIGLHLYHQRKLAQAEEEFRRAIGQFDKDARYFYFLGLTQYELGTKAKRDSAAIAWEQASRLEANGRPNTREINMALERIQGDRRALLNGYRGKAAIEK
jgi:hypothetical protein